jgi:hypothetical protein
MRSISQKAIVSSFIGFGLVLALVVFTTPLASAIEAVTVGGGWNSPSGAAERQKEDNRPYSVSAIRACISANVPSDTGSSTPTTITKEKGNALVSCIKNARERRANSDAVSELLKKIEELRAQIQALRKN